MNHCRSQQLVPAGPTEFCTSTVKPNTPHFPSEHHNSLNSAFRITENFSHQSLFFITASQQCPLPQLCLPGCCQELWSSDRQTDRHRADSTCLHHSPGLCCLHKLSALMVQDLSCRSVNSGVLSSLFTGLSSALNSPREVKAEQCAHTPACGVKPILGTRQRGMSCNLLRCRSTSEVVKPLNRAWINLLSLL